MDKAQAKQKFNCNDSQPVLAILGGSQGSVPLNHHFQKECKKYTQSGIQILWQCGKINYESLHQSVDETDVHLIPFTDDMGALYSAADLIVSRAGALALSEMALMGKAMVLVPFPHSAGDHQLKNAQAFSKSGAAVVLPQSKLPTGNLETTVLDLFNKPEKIQEMEKQSIQMAAPDATENIVSTIMEIAIS
ncbi:MAG: hypothetical protein H8E85_06285 [Candidatus Marinimicrobia bacterium]|nr:hypothetical protein [Candidatus Neomarinimicrobiota bacterium]